MADAAQRKAEFFEDEPHDVDVAPLAVRAHIVDAARPPRLQDPVDGGAVVAHVQPVAHLQAVSVHGQRLSPQGRDDHARDELFGELVRPVVVGRAADGDEHAVGARIRGAQQVCPRLGRGVRAGRPQRRVFRAAPLRSVQIAVHLVGRDVVEALHPVPAAGFQQRLRARRVGAHEHRGVGDGTVDVALRREMDHGVRPVLFQRGVQRGAVGHVGAHEGEAGRAAKGRERLRVARVGELVQADQLRLRVFFAHVKEEIAADEPGAAGDQ